MRAHLFGIVLITLCVPPLVHAQTLMHLGPTPEPVVNAAAEKWQLSGEAIYYKGDFYYPTGPTEFFDGHVMVRTGTHDGVPLYENTTLVPYEIVYVPVGGKRMKPYERRRDGRIAGTTGSRTPSFPVQPRTLATQAASMLDDSDRVSARMATDKAQWDWPSPPRVVEPAPLTDVPGRRAPVLPAGVVNRVPARETTNSGPFLLFDGARYFSSGRAVSFNAERFTRIGVLNGTAVFREVKGNAQTIFVESVPGGPIAPYTRR